MLVDKLPNEVKTLISRKFGNNIWTIDELLEYFKEEVQARERCTSKRLTNRSDGNKSDYLISVHVRIVYIVRIITRLPYVKMLRTLNGE